MIKVGFIDYYLDEWHANTYPDYFARIGDGKFKIECAYAKIDSPIGGMTTKQWGEDKGIPICDTIEEVIERSDVLIVLSPDNPEMHKELCDLPLKSGKLTYIDKTFAPDKQTALEIFANANEHNTKCYSSSALRFAAELKEIDPSKVKRLYMEGPGRFEEYSIHQLEPIMSIMKVRAKRIMALGGKENPSLIIEFEDGRFAQMRQSQKTKFKITTINEENEAAEYPITSPFFDLFVADMFKFFETGELPVPQTETVDIIAAIEAGFKAFKEPFKWIEI